MSVFEGKYKCVDPRTNLRPGEPWFFLRAQDALAPMAVLKYAEQVRRIGDLKGHKECVAMADQMKAWQKQNPDFVKNPD